MLNSFTKLKNNFYTQDTLKVAEALLGKYLVYKNCVGQIIETEAYHQFNDESCHAFKGLTNRNKSMFLNGGHLYIYKIHQVFCLNIVTEQEGIGTAVLIRGIVPVNGIETMKQRRNFKKNLTNGPGKVCQAFAIDKSLDGLNITETDSPLWIEDREINYSSKQIHKTPRIGISKAREYLWRFFIPTENLMNLSNQ